jgi:hypothetical protein
MDRITIIPSILFIHVNQELEVHRG